MQIKALLYGGLALLIVGLFLFLGYQLEKVESLSASLAHAEEKVTQYQAQEKELLAAANRKAGAAFAYQAMTTYVQNLSTAAGGVIKSYKARETENEKCLDLSPPSTLIEQLRSVYSADSLHTGSSKPLPANSLSSKSRTP